MKKIITIICIILMLATFSACGEPKTDLPTDSKEYYGSVNDIAGNSIVLSLADENKTPENGEGDEIGGGIIAGIIMMPSVPAEKGDSFEEGGSTIIGGELGENEGLVFTGEKKEFIVPAGVKIENSMGSEIGFDKIKKNSVIKIFEEDGVVYKIIVW